MTVDAGAPTAPVEPHKNSFQRLAGVLVAPAETFSDIVRKPDWFVPLLLIVVLSTAAAFIIAQHLDFESAIRAKLTEQNVKGEAAENAIALGKKIAQFTPIFTFITSAGAMLVLALVFMVGFKMFGADGDFLQFFSVSLYAWIPQVIKGIFTTLLTMRAGLLSQEELMAVLKSNPGFLVDPVHNRIGFALLSSIDVFNFWTIALLIIGLAIAAKTTRAKSAAVVLTLYVVVILGKVAIAAITPGAAG